MKASNTNGVQVVVRLRPLNAKEKKEGTLPVVTCNSDRREVAVIKGVGNRAARSAFRFDGVFSLFTTQEEIFDQTLRPMIDDVMRGYESTVFAYGQTGTGKTYTMEGDITDEEKMGVIPRASKELFDRLAGEQYFDTRVTVSYLEIYNEELGDLLANKSTKSGKPSIKLQIVDGGKGKPGQNKGKGVHCQGLTEIEVTGSGDVLKTLQRAQERRRVGETRMNKHSSRSHCMFTVSVSTKERTIDGITLQRNGCLHMVDLAGSECAKTAGNGSKAREAERANINKSLLALGRVIVTLKEMSKSPNQTNKSSRRRKQVAIPYRDSKLTRLLQESLGGHCKTCIIATVSPSVLCADETTSTLQYAQRAHGIQNKPTADVKGVMGGIPSDASGITVDSYQAMQTRLAYLEAQVEEAQGALGRKQEIMQDALDRCEAAELEVETLKEDLEDAKTKLDKEKAQKETVQDRLLEVQDDAKTMGERSNKMLGNLSTEIADMAETQAKSNVKLNTLVQKADEAAAQTMNSVQCSLLQLLEGASANLSNNKTRWQKAASKCPTSSKLLFMNKRRRSSS